MLLQHCCKEVSKREDRAAAAWPVRSPIKVDMDNRLSSSSVVELEPTDRVIHLRISL